MSTSHASVSAYMTASPHSIGAEQSLDRARTVMRTHGIRHLPVLHGGELVGIVSDRDIRLVEAFEDLDPTLITVSDAMSREVYSVPPTAPLDEVALEMSVKKYGSVVIMEGRKVIGILTTVDACRALADYVRAERPS